jgi:hypothetical protein
MMLARTTQLIEASEVRRVFSLLTSRFGDGFDAVYIVALFVLLGLREAHLIVRVGLERPEYVRKPVPRYWWLIPFRPTKWTEAGRRWERARGVHRLQTICLVVVALFVFDLIS